MIIGFVIIVVGVDVIRIWSDIGGVGDTGVSAI